MLLPPVSNHCSVCVVIQFVQYIPIPFKHFTAPHLFCKLTLHFNHPQSHSNR